MMLKRPTLLLVAALGIASAWARTAVSTDGKGEVLHNGIMLPSVWPPDYGELSREPMVVPYLQRPPARIPIDLGRQLFVDDFLIEQTTLTRTFHRAVPYEGNPVLRPDSSWEKGQPPDVPCARPMSDGVWFDPRDSLFKMWYMAAVPAGVMSNQPEGGRATCYATSRDGLHWERPMLDVVPGTNIVLTEPRDSAIVWLDTRDPNPARRFKLMRNARAANTYFSLTLHVSADGIHWTGPVASTGGLSWIGDRHSAFFNPFRNVWVYSMRNTVRRDPAYLGRRVRLYHEAADVAAGLESLQRHPWVAADRLDPRHPQFPDFEPQLYTLDAVAYESLMIGLFSILEGPENEDARANNLSKRNEVVLGFSRDGFHWHRPDRRPFLGVSEIEGAWNWGYVQSVGGGFLVVGDRLYFYYSGQQWTSKEGRVANNTGVAFLRRDGFASMDADERPGTLTTCPLLFEGGRELFVNADAGRGELRVEVLDQSGAVITPFSLANCRPIRIDSTKQPVSWNGAVNLSALAGQPVRFRFHLREGSLFAFWVSPDKSGASCGYVAAGGPGFEGLQDLPSSAAARSTARVARTWSGARLHRNSP